MRSLSKWCLGTTASSLSIRAAKLLGLSLMVALVIGVVTSLEISPETTVKVDQVVVEMKFPLNFAKNSFKFENESRSARQKRQVAGCPQAPNCNVNAIYRTIDGTCNNLVYDTLAGSAGIPFRRFLNPIYANGLNTPRQTNPPLPKPRSVTVAMSNLPPGTSSVPVSLMLMHWGQFVAHDIEFTPTFNIAGNPCCDTGTNPVTNHPECMPIDVSGDSFFSPKNIVCLNFVRSLAASSTCTSNVRQQINSVTAFIDGSLIYGSSAAEQQNVRTFTNGKLKISSGSGETGQTCSSFNVCPYTFLPVNSNGNFFAGDARVEQNPGITSLQTLFVRAHNDFCNKLKLGHPGYTDETLYQEARRIIGALIQKFTYVEFLPIVLGSTYLNSIGMGPVPSGQYLNYFDDVNPSLSNVFGTAAFRFGHSMITDNTNLENNVVIPLRQNFNNHQATLNTQSFPSQFLRGIPTNPSSPLDQSLVPAVTNFLYAAAPFTSGSDLYSRNIQRGREHGLRSYNEWRAYCGYSTFTSFSQLNSVMGSSVASAFQSLYNSVNDIDLFPAGISELPISNGILGPTFSCILGEMFYYLRFGDRFFYENQAHPYPFTINQLNIIGQTSLASMVCSFTSTTAIQPKVLLLPGSTNPVTSCSQQVQNTVQTLIQTNF